MLAQPLRLNLCMIVIPLPLSVTQLPLRDYYVTAIYYVIAFLLYSTRLDSLVDYPFLPLFPSPSSFPLVYTCPLPIYLIHRIVSRFSVERRRLVCRPLSMILQSARLRLQTTLARASIFLDKILEITTSFVLIITCSFVMLTWSGFPHKLLKKYPETSHQLLRKKKKGIR